MLIYAYDAYQIQIHNTYSQHSHLHLASGMLRAFVGGRCAVQPFLQLVVKLGPHLTGETVVKPGNCSQMLFSQHISGKMLYRAEVVTLYLVNF